MVAQSIAYAVSGIFSAAWVITLWHWWTTAGNEPRYFWGSFVYLVIAYAVAWVGGI